MLSSRKILPSFIAGFVAAGLLLGIYFGIVSLISGWRFAQNQFGLYWYFIVTLAFGFGVQIGLFVYLKNVIRERTAAGKIVAVSGTTSTVAMLACCAHYLANIVPLIGVAGAITVISQYQTELFWVGIAANVVGITYIASKIRAFNKAHV